jgi:hypothetical protein
MKHFLVLAFAAALYGQQQTMNTQSDDSASGAVAGSGGAMAETPASDTTGTQTGDTNVNSRYTVESVGIANLRHYYLPKSLLEDMQNLVGMRFSSEKFQNLAARISSELHGHQVQFNLARGTDPAHVRVTFEEHGPRTGFDVDVPKVAYTTSQGLSAEGDLIVNVDANKFTFAMLSDGDSLVERATGIRARYDRLAVGSDRIRLGFEFDTYHEQYNRATEDAATQTNDLSALYRNRRNFEPSATVAIAAPLTWAVGLSFQQFEQQYPTVRTESSNAVVTSLRYDRKWEDDSAGSKHRFSAGYSLRAAYAYTRHAVDATYHWRRGRQSAEAMCLAGGISGQAPLFERFVLGNSTTLRGWDKFELDPLGGGRMIYGSAGYGYGKVRTFYDAGAIWDKGAANLNGTGRQGVKHSAGIGVKIEGILLAVAFPIRNDHMEPVFIAGMNF